MSNATSRRNLRVAPRDLADRRGRLCLRRIPVGLIKPAAYNPRRDLRPGDAEYDRLDRSMREFGCVEPLVWNQRTGNLVGGHQRFKILLAQGAREVDVSVVDLSPEREKALNIALNKIVGAWDEQKLADLLGELAASPQFDVSLTGFDLPEARALIDGVLGSSSAEAFDIQAALDAANRGPPVTKPGDLIVLGREPKLQHRLLCGDSTDRAQVRRLMDGVGGRAALMATDPPYLVGYDGTNHPGKGKFKNKDWSATYGVTWDDAASNPGLYDGFLSAAVAEAIRRDAAVYVWHASKRQAMVEESLQKAGMLVHAQIIWAKNRPVLTRTWYTWQHEPCLMAWRQGHKPRRPADPLDRRRPVRSTLWQIDTLPNGPERPDHPTPKPVELFMIPIEEHTRPGEICYEPFAGSGTQIIAAQRLGRRCFAIEISPVYCDLIVRRFIALAGEDSVDPKVARRYRLRGGNG